MPINQRSKQEILTFDKGSTMKSPAMQQMSVMDLLRLHRKILTDLKDRDVVRSNNNPTSDYAEWLAAKTLGLTLGGKAAGFDATDSKGIRYRIRGCRITDDNPSTRLPVPKPPHAVRRLRRVGPPRDPCRLRTRRRSSRCSSPRTARRSPSRGRCAHA